MYYLIEHNRTSKETQLAEYSDYAGAQMAGLQKEQQHFQNNHHEMEVVVFEANSIDDLKRTHSRYFVKAKEKDNTAGALLAVGLVGLAVYLLSKK
ncbi:hypothetical protein [Catenovulum agarivorans]|uniref:hypothetical protein n=1 Tax=Catenovulum agarivorans TaxID=1172192 RepID=UPI0002E281CE|nr:hypothetical protein [Catenovulum agarivorans]